MVWGEEASHPSRGQGNAQGIQGWSWSHILLLDSPFLHLWRSCGEFVLEDSHFPHFLRLCDEAVVREHC